MGLVRSIVDRWREKDSGYRHVLLIAWPLILSSGSWSIQLFCDRKFLSDYSSSAVAAALPAGMVSFTIVSFFMGVANYANVFVAQYTGAEKHDKVGPAVWQGLYFSVLAAIVGFAVKFFSRDIFELVKSDSAIIENEIVYFDFLVYGIGFVVASSAVSCFYSGRGKTLVVMVVNLIATGVNVLLNYVLIFGNWGFPEMGMKGAAIGTVASQVTACGIFLFLFLSPSNRAEFNTLKGRRFNKDLFMRMVRYGAPNGFQFTVDVLSFTVFVFLVQKLGTVPLAASTIAFTINTVAFLPMVGCSIAVSTIVGQHLGRNRPDLAERSTRSAFHITVLYMAVISFFYAFFPDIFVSWFGSNVSGDEYNEIRSMVRLLLKFTAFYSFFDAICFIFSAAIKGAGDTFYVTVVMTIASWVVMVIPTYVTIEYFGGGIIPCWVFLSLYAVSLAGAFYLRFRGGKWKSMRVIEVHPPVSPIPPNEGMPLPDGEILP